MGIWCGLSAGRQRMVRSSRLVEGVGAELVKQHSCAGSWSGAGAVKEADAAGLMGETKPEGLGLSPRLLQAVYTVSHCLGNP